MFGFLDYLTPKGIYVPPAPVPNFLGENAQTEGAEASQSEQSEVDGVALAEAKRRQERKERTAKIITFTVIAIVVGVGIYFLLKKE